MNYVEKVLDGVHTVLNLNAATLSGAIDIIVVPQEDGSLKSTPFHVRFGKLHLLNSNEKVVEIGVNGELAPLKMKLGSAGEAFFVEETEEPVPESYITSPLSTSPVSSLPSSPPSERKFYLNDEAFEERKKEQIETTLTSRLEGLLEEELREEGEEPSSNHTEEIEDKIQQEIAEAKLQNNYSVSQPIPISPQEELNFDREIIATSTNRALEETNLDGQLISDSPTETSWGWGSLPKLRARDSDVDEDRDLEEGRLREDSLSSVDEAAEEKEDDVQSDDIQMDDKSGETWTKKVGSLFRIFKGSTVPTPPQEKKEYISENDYEDDDEFKDAEEGPFDDEIRDSSSTEEELERAKELEIQLKTVEQKEEMDIKKSNNEDEDFSEETIELENDEDTEDLETKQLIPRPEEEIIQVEQKRDEAVSPKGLFGLDIQMSKCGNILGEDFENFSEEEQMEIFDENLIYYEDFIEKPELVFDASTIFKIENKLYPWSVAAPFIVSALVYHKPLEKSMLDKLESKWAQRKRKSWSLSWLGWRRNNSKPQLPPNVPPKKKYYKKSLRPTSEQLKSLNLKYGPNEISFTVTSALQGIKTVKSTVYFWDHNVKIVISDIDGTITKSDVFGHILPMLGRDWSHSGVAQLYSNIRANNYEILYLTSRPIGSADLTRGYITKLKQGDIKLPQGPVFMSPERLLTSFNREVILRRPEEFKIECLKDIKSLFPKDCHPFYAGFGNRPTDALSYQAVDMPLGKIFIINYKGEISIVNRTYRKTFNSLNELVNAMFPAINTSNNQDDEQWNDWNYWKAPLPEMDVNL